MNVVSTSHGFVLSFWTREKMLALAEALIDQAGQIKDDTSAPHCVCFFGKEVTEERRTEILQTVKQWGVKE